MILNNNAIVVNYPNQVGDYGRYPLRDQREYFSKFEGGASYIFELALRNVVDGSGVVTFADQCSEVLERYYDFCFAVNAVTMQQYHEDRREFQRRIFDIYRYAKSSLGVLGEDLGFSLVRRIATNRNFDSSSFLLKYE